MAKGKKSEKTKRILLAVLAAVLVFIFIYQFFLAGPPPRPQVKRENGATGRPANTARGEPAGQAGRPPGKQSDISQLLADLTPLELGTLDRQTAAADVSRNIFAYYVKPPAPPPPPPPPPPIALRFVQPQTAVAGTPKAFTLTVTGQNFPPDARILFGGVAKPTKRLNDNELRTEITPADYATHGTKAVEVKSESKPAELYSNAISFVVQQSPDPPFKFIGIIGDLGVFEVTTSSGKEHVRVRRGGTIGGVWRVDSIGDSGAEVTDTRYDIRKRVPF